MLIVDHGVWWIHAALCNPSESGLLCTVPRDRLPVSLVPRTLVGIEWRNLERAIRVF